MERQAAAAARLVEGMQEPKALLARALALRVQGLVLRDSGDMKGSIAVLRQAKECMEGRTLSLDSERTEQILVLAE